MPEQTPASRLLKARAKETMRRSMAPCLAGSALLLAVTLAGTLLLGRTGGLVFPGLLETADFNVGTGLWSASAQWLTDIGLGSYAAQGGAVAALRVEAARLIMVYVVPWVQLRPWLITTLLVFLLSAPARYGCLSLLWRVAEERPAPPSGLLSWYLDLRLTGKALGLQLVVGLWEWAAQLLCMAPAMGLMILCSGAPGTSPVWYLILLLMVVGLLGGFYVSLLLAPARLLLARRPERGIGDALRSGWAALAGRRGAFFRLQLSFLPWYLVSIFTYGISDLLLFPYQQLASIYFLDGAPEREALPHRSGE